MTQVLSGLPGVVYYIDDIFSYWANKRRTYQKFASCTPEDNQFFTRELEFLGHSITPEGVKPTKSHIKSILEAPVPTSKQEIQLFLGMLTYNAKFLPNMSHTLHPLNQLLRKNTSWVWKTKQQKAFSCKKLTQSRYSTYAL